MILTPDRRLRVFISSTLDLADERAAVRQAVESLELAPVMFEAGARPHPPRALYRAYVEQSDVFVAVYSRRYGWTAPGMEISGLEDEYRLSAGLPRLVYIQAGVEREAELTSFLERVRDDGLSYRPFRTPDELEHVVKNDLVVLLTERFHAGAEPPAASEARVARNVAPLPRQPALFIGRDDDVAAVRRVLEGGGARLVTLVGPGGVGKTSLAIAAARDVADHFHDGVHFVSLASVRQPHLVADAISTALGVSTCDACPALASVADFFAGRRALLVLDNFEQVVDAAPTVSDLLAACPDLTVLVTSRAPLRVRAEREISVHPLAVDVAVELFTRAVRNIRPDFEPDERNAAAIVELCRELDGLPLALELAAALVRVVSPVALLERLRGGIEVGGTLRDVPDRHRGLHAAIAWSYELLDEPTRELFAELSVFQGGFTLEHVERICVVNGDALALLAALVEHSLVRADVDGRGAARFSMLATIRRFAAEQLDGTETAAVVRTRHATVFAELAATVGAPRGRHPEVLDGVETELDNIRAALAHLLDTGDADRVADAIGESWWFWWIRGYVNEGRYWADRVLRMAGLGEDARARALSARAMLAIWSGEYDVAVPAFTRAAEAAVRSGDRRSVAYADIGVGLVRAMTDSLDEGAGLIRRGTRVLDDIGDELGATSGLAALAWLQGILRQFDRTDAILREALARARDSGSDVDVGIVESAIAQHHLVRDEDDAAIDLIGQSLEHLAAARHVGSTILALEVIAELGVRHGIDAEAASLLGATAAVRAEMGTRVPPAAASRLEELLATTAGRLGEAFTPAYEEGAHLHLSQAVDGGRALLGLLRRRRTP